MPVNNLTKNTVICEQAERADTFFTRVRGLMGRKELPINHGLILQPCTSVHTCFMRFAIDVIFVKENTIIGLAESLRPWRISPVFWHSAFAIELPAGTIKKSNSVKGDKITII